MQLYYSSGLNPRVAVEVAKYLNSPVEFIRGGPRDVATGLPFTEEAIMLIGPYKNIAKWHDRLNKIDAWRDPFTGIAA